MANLLRPSLLRNGWSCTSLTLAQQMTLCGYPEAARSLVPALNVDSDPALWRSDETPIDESIRHLVDCYIHAKQLIRCSHLSQRQTLLLRPYQEGEWLLHRIAQDDRHVFIYIKQEEVPRRIAQFYRLSSEPLEQSRECRLTDAMFDWLCAPDRTQPLPHHVHWPHDEEDFNQLIADLQFRQQDGLDHISHFTISSAEQHYSLQHLVFFLPSTRGVWIAQREANADRPVVIRLYSHEDWLSLLEVIGETNR